MKYYYYRHRARRYRQFLSSAGRVIAIDLFYFSSFNKYFPPAEIKLLFSPYSRDLILACRLSNFKFLYFQGRMSNLDLRGFFIFPLNLLSRESVEIVDRVVPSIARGNFIVARLERGRKTKDKVKSRLIVATKIKRITCGKKEERKSSWRRINKFQLKVWSVHAFLKENQSAVKILSDTRCVVQIFLIDRAENQRVVEFKKKKTVAIVG